MLLGKQATRQQWHWVGGRVKTGEKLKVAARREVKEETALIPSSLELVHTERIELDHNIEIIYCFSGRVQSDIKMCADGREIDQLGWFSLNETGGLALTETTRQLMQNISIITLFI